MERNYLSIDGASLDDPHRKSESENATAVLPQVPATIIDIPNIKPAEVALPEIDYKAAVKSLLTKSSLDQSGRGAAQKPIESCSRYHGRLVAEDDSFAFPHHVMSAAHRAFCDHRPLVLSPDIVWLMVAQGFANHVNANAERLRPQLVKHQGQIKITVRRDDFIKGAPENPWEEVFEAFTECIREHIGTETHDLILPSFSTTGAVERAAAQVVLMDAMQSYFSYSMVSLCGIPRVVLEGSADDWDQVARKTRELGRFDLEWWTLPLAPVLAEFAAAARGQVNLQFWQSIYKLEDRSGGPNISGWITAFFPYLKDDDKGPPNSRNRWIRKGGAALQALFYPAIKDDSGIHGPTMEMFPSGLSRVPFVWPYFGQKYLMEFVAGFVGVQQDTATLRLTPEIGWVVREQAAG